MFGEAVAVGAGFPGGLGGRVVEKGLDAGSDFPDPQLP